MKHVPVRVRFAPAPTGMMHLGNIRQAVINALYARQNSGSFILRIEDTDQQRMFDNEGARIQQDLAWLNILPDESPLAGGAYGPYIQSKRTKIYERYRAQLEAEGFLYRCFCTTEELERKRSRQIELKKAPRYDRTCMHLTPHEVQSKLSERSPFIWRFRIDPAQVIIHDLVRGPITFDMSNFPDIPLTRQDGSFTFIFANCIDDIAMKISHIFRGEDHLSNSATQAMIYRALNAPLPEFWHTPIICNTEGKKLSKRDFGFSLDDLRRGGFMPEAIINYLSIIGQTIKGSEVASFEELAQRIDFSHHSSANTIRYDSDKLRWMNHAWIKRLPAITIAERVSPFLIAAYPSAAGISIDELTRIMGLIQNELETLVDAVPLLYGYFQSPSIQREQLELYELTHYQPVIESIIAQESPRLNATTRLDQIKMNCQQHGLALKNLLCIIRIALTGSTQGTTMSNLLQLIPHHTFMARLRHLLSYR